MPEPQRTRFYDLAGGMNDTDTGYMLEPKESRRLTNVRFIGRGAGRLRGGRTAAHSDNVDLGVPDYGIRSLYKFRLQDGTRWFLVAGGKYMYAMRPPAFSFTSGDRLISGYAPGATWRFDSYKDWLYMVGGLVASSGTDYSLPRRWDGASVSTLRLMGCPTSAAPTAADQSGGSLDATKYYSYKVSYLYGASQELGESNGSPSVEEATTVTNKTIRVTQPTLPGNGETKWVIYRNQTGQTLSADAAAGPWYFLAEVAIGTTTYDDTGAVSLDLTYEPPTDNGLPERAQHIASHNDTMFIANLRDRAADTLYPNRIQFSEAGYADIFPSLNLREVGRGDEITGIIPAFGFLVVTKWRSIWGLFGTTPDTYEPLRLVSGIGCVSSETLAMTPAGLMGLDQNGIFLFDGRNARHISGKMRKTIDSILPGARVNACAAFVDGREYILSFDDGSLGEIDPGTEGGVPPSIWPDEI